MRKEFLGPLPLVVGAIALAVALTTTTGPPPTDCACPVYTAEQFAAQDAQGYPAAAVGDELVVDGKVVQVVPHPLVDADWRHIRLEGADIQFNVTRLDAPVPYEGSWVRLTTVHQGQSEGAGPDTGHRWTYRGPTTPTGDPLLSVSAASAGLVVVLWGLATVPAFRRARDGERDLKVRIAAARERAAAEPAFAGAPERMAALGAARRHVRFGQFEAAKEELGAFERLLDRAGEVGKMAAGIGRGLADMEVDGRRGTGVRAAMDEARTKRAAGDVPGAEKALGRAMAELQAGARAVEALERARALISAGFEGDAPERAGEAAARAQEQLVAGAWRKAEEEALAARAAAVEGAPAARRARQAIDALEEAVQSNRTGDAAREVTHQMVAATGAFATGDYGRATALAEAARWVAQEGALDEEGVRSRLVALWSTQGYAPVESAPPPPGGGAVVAKGSDRVLLLTGTWREYPPERVLLAAKDYIRAGNADRARVYSSAFANTSTDPRIVVVTLRGLLEELTQAAGLPPP